MHDQEWVNKLLNSLDNVEKAQPDESFLQRMESVAVRYVSTSKRVTRPALLSIAASMLLLIFANVYTIRTMNANETTGQEVGYESTGQYDLVPAKSFYYE